MESMSVAFRSGQEDPLFHLGEYPVRLITLLVALHSAAMIAVSLTMASGHGAWLDLFAYKTPELIRGQVWRLFTYAFVATPSVWFLLEMLMLYYFGREVENGLGWKRFALLYAGLILIAPLLLLALGTAGLFSPLAGAEAVNFAVFAAFAAMHPGAQFFFGVAARWVFLGLFAITALQRMADHQTPQVVILAGSCILAIVLMRRAGFTEPLLGEGIQWSLPRWRKKTSGGVSVMPGGISASSARAAGKTAEQAPTFDPELEMDRLLEKISLRGIASLSADEKKILEQARRAMLQRSGGTPPP
jgi:membrane associated rhomboid family serine protease